MPPFSKLQIDDAKRILPPAAHRATSFVQETGDLVSELNELKTRLENCLEVRPHDRTEILALVESFKKNAMTLHGQAVHACQTIRTGR